MLKYSVANGQTVQLPIPAPYNTAEVRGFSRDGGTVIGEVFVRQGTSRTLDTGVRWRSTNLAELLGGTNPHFVPSAVSGTGNTVAGRLVYPAYTRTAIWTTNGGFVDVTATVGAGGQPTSASADGRVIGGTGGVQGGWLLNDATTPMFLIVPAECMTADGQTVFGTRGSVMSQRTDGTIRFIPDGPIPFHSVSSCSADGRVLVGAGIVAAGNATRVEAALWSGRTGVVPFASILGNLGFTAGANCWYTRAQDVSNTGRSVVGTWYDETTGMGGSWFLRLPLPCTVADVAMIGGLRLPDRQLTADDLVVFLEAFFANDRLVADIAAVGGALEPDDQLTVDDVIVFLSEFFGGCG